MKDTKLFLGIGLIIFFTACTTTNSAPTFTDTPVPSVTATPPPAPTSTPRISPPPIPTSTPITEPNNESKHLFTWPIPPLSDEQIQEVLNCQKETWSDEMVLDIESIAISTPTTACDYSLLAMSHLENPAYLALSDPGWEAAKNAVQLNPGIVFANPYFFLTFQALDIVEAPTLITSALKQVQIIYTWGGLGSSVDSAITIETEKSAWATGEVEIGPDMHSSDEGTEGNLITINQEVSRELIDTLGQSLTNLIPVKHQGTMMACFDNYPDWTIVLSYENGQEITLKTNESNYFLEGGPFQTQIDGQNYIMASYEFNMALLSIIEQLKIPLGEPGAMACFAMPIADLLYTGLIIP